MFKCEEKIALLENDVKDIKEARKWKTILNNG
jgi:hypothetical protein